MQFAGSENGHFFIHWPEDFQLGQEISDQVAIYVTPAPVWRVLLLFGGLSLVVLWNALARLLGAGRLAGDGLLPAAASAAPPPVLSGGVGRDAAARRRAPGRSPGRSAPDRPRPRRAPRSRPALLRPARCDTLSPGPSPSAEEAP